ncbi:RssA Predicted esterase of the alpha-beta hydrolase superfamily [uncultured Caudovirales phage]|uniref:RssA Predicted esterase of the alpha-beta hydrolase superfamily n=1 Tax=uncultured Caudovirales phage TaxID=2100421 RepID=A0A6J5LA49_9CAUD|nr:RssA Predicted esterase of the alpha-beta hydrolase superfamily [uncultured Caudovirales phage]
MKKIGIVLGGGGAKGAFQIGVLECLLASIKNSKDQLVSISGTSIGAMNGAFVAAGQFNKLKEHWAKWSNKTCPLTQTGPFGSTASLLTSGYSYKSKPTFDFFKQQLDIKALRNSAISYTNTRIRLSDSEVLLGGTYSASYADSKKDDDLIYEIMASMAAIPLVPIVNVYGEGCVDGGFRDTVPVKAMLTTNDQMLDHIYVIGCNPINRLPKNQKFTNTIWSLIDKMQFGYDMLWDEVSRNDISLGNLKHWDVDHYTVICPEEQILSAAEFDPVKIKKATQHGRDMWNQL